MGAMEERSVKCKICKDRSLSVLMRSNSSSVTTTYCPGSYSKPLMISSDVASLPQPEQIFFVAHAGVVALAELVKADVVVLCCGVECNGDVDKSEGYGALVGNSHGDTPLFLVFSGVSLSAARARHTKKAEVFGQRKTKKGRPPAPRNDVLF